MNTARLGLALVASIGLVAAACATAGVAVDVSDGGVDANTTCPEFDLQNDAKHCGSCTNACAAGQVCSAGVCKGECDAPTVKCSGAQTCSDLTKDPKNCGQCGTECKLPDAAVPDTGTGNPDSGIPVPDGGVPFDAGTGWSLPSPQCDGGKCSLTCAGGATFCSSDDLCWDTKNAHDHCGDCNTACAAGEWCMTSHCCAPGKMNCASVCIDVLSDPANCGGCGITCSGGTPTCVSGSCSAGNHDASQLAYDATGGAGGCGDFSTFATQNFGMKTYDECETLANQYGAQFVGAPSLYAYSPAYAAYVRWVGEQTATMAYVSSGSWNVVNVVSKTTPQYCVLGYANGTTHGSTTFSTVAVSNNGKSYFTQDYGVISEATCYTNARNAGARPLNPAMFNLSLGATHMVENHSCHGSVEYSGATYTTNGGSAHTYRCFLGYTP